VRHPSTLSHLAGANRQGEIAKVFDWTRQTKELLSRLQHILSETLKFWERFNSQNGDIDFFSDMDSSQDRCNLSLGTINETFETLESLQRTLDCLIRSCEDYAIAVS
jgi:hypothetical protein